ncbi:hypothetical protein A2U01_0055011, partial [Trifolium medium]|nr:hypothetical protein [Trifolium medium]
MSLSDFIDYIQHDLSGEMDSGNPSFSAERLDYLKMLDDVGQHLLSDNQVTIASNDNSFISRVSSLCNILQLDPAEVLNSLDKGPGKNIQLGHDL